MDTLIYGVGTKTFNWAGNGNSNNIATSLFKIWKVITEKLSINGLKCLHKCHLLNTCEQADETLEYKNDLKSFVLLMW